MPTDDSYKYVEDSAQSLSLSDVNVNDEENNRLVPVYRFLHDRVQQAAYSMIEENSKSQIHLKIGRELLKATPENELDEHVFTIVDQLNMSSELMTDEAERERLANLNLIAGKKAKLSAAYNPAFDYLKSGINVLKADCWQSQYNLTLSIFEEAAEAAYLCGDYEEMERIAETVLQHAKTVLDTIKVYEVKIQAHASQHKLLDAVKTGLNVLNLLGVNFPEKPNKFNVLTAYMQTKIALFGKTTDDLLTLPEMTAPYKCAILRILASTGPSTYLVSPKLMPLLIFKGLNISLKYGNNIDSIFFYNTYGLVLCGVLGDIDTGIKFGELALRLSEKLNATLLESTTQGTFNVFIKHWKKHIRETLQSVEKSFQRGLETGDFYYAGVCGYCYIFHSYSSGINLIKLEQTIVKYNDILKK
ncbi:MAG: hypothetical protein HQK64_06160 [Desulfamplus sp.]|nr:hypothetical protein [Desulfamplus sp.]